MTSCLFVSDLHGHLDRYYTLLALLKAERPQLVFLGGDLLPSSFREMTSLPHPHLDFINDFLLKEFHRLRALMGKAYPEIFLILGNDDSRFEEPAILDFAAAGYCQYIHNRRVACNGFDIYGYGCIPPSPFLVKDWERYDVSRYVDPGCVSPEEGWHSVPVSEQERKYATIQNDLNELTGQSTCEHALFMFHAPPYQSSLDRAELDGKMVDYVPVDVHVGSIAIRRFIEARQPLVTLHGHVHESARLTGNWKEQIGRTWAFSAAHDGPELAVVRFTLECPESATRELV